jgi:membrane associated rhomboid family serine protease
VNLPLSGALVIFLVTIVVSLIGLFGAPQVIERSLFRPYWVLRRKQYLSVIASGFVHADLMHLIFNMMTFYFFGFLLESRIVHADLMHLIFNMMTFYFFGFLLESRIGTVRFVILYFAGLLISHAGTYVKQQKNPDYACLGASGAISAVLFAAIVYFPEQSLFIIPIPIPIPAPLFAVLYLAYTYYASRHPHGRINHDAHLGGAITGLVFVAMTDPAAYRHLVNSLF